MDLKKLANDKQSLTAFVKFPSSLYAGDPHFVPQIVNQEVDRLLNEKSLENRCHFSYYMVYENQKPIARVAAGIFKNLNHKSKRNRGIFCYFESENNIHAVRMLFDSVIADFKEYSVDEFVLYDSTRFSQFGKGLLLQHDNVQDKALFPYHFPYYKELLEEYGFMIGNKHETYTVSANDFPYEKFMLLSERAMKRFDYRIESYILNPSNIDKLTDKLLNIVHQCYSPEWELPQPSFYDLKVDLEEAMRYSNSNHLIFAFADERIVGAFFVYANYYQRLKNYNGNLFPQYYFDKAMNANANKNYIANFVFVVPDYQRKAVDLSMVCKAYTILQTTGVQNFEVFVIPTLNTQYEKVFLNIGGTKTSKYGQFTLNAAKHEQW